MKASHQVGVLFCNGLIIVMHQNPKLFVLTRFICALYELLEPRDHLFKRLLVNTTASTVGIKVKFVDALCKEPHGPVCCNAVCNFGRDGSSLVQRQVYICTLVCICLLDLSVHLALAAALDFKQMCISFARDGSSSLCKVKGLEAWDIGLFEVFS